MNYSKKGAKMKATSIDVKEFPFNRETYNQGFEAGRRARKVRWNKPGLPQNINFLRGYLEGKLKQNK